MRMPKVCSVVATGFIRWLLLKNDVHAEGMKLNLCSVPSARSILLFKHHGLTSMATFLSSLSSIICQILLSSNLLGVYPLKIGSRSLLGGQLMGSQSVLENTFGLAL